MTNTFTPKDLVWDEEGRRKLSAGIDKLSRAVKSTLGPSGNTVLIESENHTHGITVTKDGVTVAKAIDLLDPVENLAVRMMKEAASNTANLAGDGTTTAIVLTEAIVNNVMAEMKASEDSVSTIAITRELEKECADIIEMIDAVSIPVTDEMLFDVASISANNDRELGKIIADTYLAVGGKDGIVTVDQSDTPETTSEVIKGIRLDRGYMSPLFINDHTRDQCIMEDVHILMSDTEIGNVIHLEKILKPIIKDQLKLLIIAPCSVNVVNTLAANVMKNNLRLCIIEPPSFGYKTQELMGDVALTVNGKFFSQKVGDDLSIIEMGDLGFANRIVVSKDSTIIMRPDDVDVKAIDERIEQLWKQKDILTHKHEKDFVLERIASLKGGIGVISVGGHTDLEQKEKYDRVDDAVCAVRSALSDGIVAGGGVCLHNLAANIIDTNLPTEQYIAASAMATSLREPMLQILRNSGINDEKIEVMTTDLDLGDGIDVKTGEFGNMISMGIIDPAKVTKTALRSAVSVANTILSTNSIITMARSYETTD